VGASAPEVFFVCKAISTAKIESTRNAVQVAWEATSGRSPDERLASATPCPLLKDRLCSVYSQRPIVCRTAVSLNAEICERSFLHAAGEAIPTPAWFSGIRENYDLALCGAVRREGLSYMSCEFNSALKSVLERPDAERRWLNGENVLAGLPEDPGGDPFRDRINQQIYATAFS
jgi:Fe-S-cluster containining protein